MPPLCAFVPCALALVAVAACVAGEPPDVRDVPDARAARTAPADSPADSPGNARGMTDDSLTLALDVPAAVRAGAPVPFTFRVVNAASQARTLYLRGRTIAFDVTVVDAGGGTVWRRLEDQAIEGILQLKELAPGETLSLHATWDQRTARGRTVAAGEYRARAELLTDAAPLVSPTVAFRIATP